MPRTPSRSRSPRLRKVARSTLLVVVDADTDGGTRGCRTWRESTDRRSFVPRCPGAQKAGAEKSGRDTGVIEAPQEIRVGELHGVQGKAACRCRSTPDWPPARVPAHSISCHAPPVVPSSLPPDPSGRFGAAAGRPRISPRFHDDSTTGSVATSIRIGPAIAQDPHPECGHEWVGT